MQTIQAPEARRAVLTRREVAGELQVSEWTISHLHRTGRLVGVFVGRNLRWRPEDVERYVAKLKPAGK